MGILCLGIFAVAHAGLINQEVQLRLVLMELAAAPDSPYYGRALPKTSFTGSVRLNPAKVGNVGMIDLVRDVGRQVKMELELTRCSDIQSRSGLF